MNALPLTHPQAKALIGRMVQNRNASDFRIIGSNGHFFIKETRPIRSGKNGFAGDLTIMHGRTVGRANNATRRRIKPTVALVHHQPRMLT